MSEAARTAAFEAVISFGVAREGEAGDEDGHREADDARKPRAEDVTPSRVERQPAQPRRDRRETRHRDKRAGDEQYAARLLRIEEVLNVFDSLL
ncbi:MAG TPA: hypothetical protein VF668_11865 [Pyrinomonadaceae bacterium]